ncbi:hypothetical protein H9Y04_35255 [Streptomyces sp. TRM66268-LWL]|uniref:Uncharacterized protein n=1 Tax=Streptomyces polyasparticus TaxID=2767826 RepID=A0ABR7SQM3_9ACTN|nr:hypothetical protein [Streptomyces polyasparticus]MBC9717802.1 hypothetical protein [Streptomyces polyasparticus]
MPDTITTLAKRLAQLERRVRTLERVRKPPPPTWRDLPLTGNTTVIEDIPTPQMRITEQDTLELSGQISIPGGRSRDESVLALLPEDYRPTAPRRIAIASDTDRRPLHLELRVDGQVLLRAPTTSTIKVSMLSLDGCTCRLDDSEQP